MTITAIKNKITELAARVGLFAISKLEFFGLMTDVADKLQEIVDNLNASYKGLIWQEPVATFAALATTYPAAVQGWAAMVTGEGLIYAYNGSAWKSTGLTAMPELTSDLGTSELKVINQKVVSEELAKRIEVIIEKSTNILDSNNLIADKYVKNDGTIFETSSANYFTTDFIEWGDNSNLVSGKNGLLANLFTSAQYDENKTFIAGTWQTYVTPVNTIAKNELAKFVRITFYQPSVNQFNFGSSILAYESFYKKVSQDLNGNPIVFKPDLTDEELLSKLDEYTKDSDVAELLDLKFSMSANLLNENAKTIDKYIAANGTLAAASPANRWASTDFISWGEETKVIAGKNNVAVNIFTAAQYDANKAFIAGSYVNYTPGANSVTKVTNGVYLRIAYEMSLINMINYDESVLTYEEYSVKVSETNSGNKIVFKPDTSDNDLLALLQQGGSTESIVYPEKIYTVCNDIIQTDSGFNSRNYAACLYADHFFKLDTKKKLKFASTDSDKLPLFAPIDIDNDPYNGGVIAKTTTVNDTLKGKIEPIAISLSHISTKASATSAAFPKVLCIGDSVTNGFLANQPSAITLNNPTTYWSYARKLFHLDFVDATTGHSCLFLGKQASRQFVVGSTTVKSYAEGRGGWTMRNYLYDETYGGYTNYFYDSAKPTVKFSLTKYLANYKTLADDGITRLSVGTTAGTLVTDVNTADICTPTHVVIQMGFNDVEANWLTDIRLMIESIRAEFPTMKIIISTIDAAGTYMPENYPMFDATSVNLLGDALHAKMYNLVNSAKGLEGEYSNLYYCPSYFVQPTAWGVAYRNVDFPESMANNQFIYKTEHGAGNNYHPNTYAHAAWGYQLYAIIKYTLTL